MQRGLKKGLSLCSSLKGWFYISGLTCCPLTSHLTNVEEEKYWKYQEICLPKSNRLMNS